MLVQFSVENYLSIKDKVAFTMEATGDKTHAANLFSLKKKNNLKFLTVAAIYGANASGKSNFLNAFDFISTIVKISHTFQSDIKIPVVHFKLNAKSEKDPTCMEIIFINKGVKYRYGFSLTQERIIDEYLYSYETKKPTLIFERKNTTKYKFTRNKGIQEDIRKKTNKNALYLSTSAQWNYKPTQNALNWFEKQFTMGTDMQFPLWSNKTCEMILKSASEKDTILKNLQSADFGIFGIEVTEEELDTFNKDIPLAIRNRFRYRKTYGVKFTHLGQKDGIETTVHLTLDEESGGTKRYFEIIGPIIESIKKGKTIIFDEFDTNIHPLLLRKITEMFLDPKINENGAQLIFATHATSLLDSELLRRDQIWFTEKKQNGSTDLYSLGDFQVRKDAVFEKGYLLGRYGAIPFLPSGNLL